MELRVLDVEKYNSKDSIVINNPPIRQGCNIMRTILDFMNDIFGTAIKPEQVVACHQLGGFSAGPPAVIIKFVYFRDKEFFWKHKYFLKGITNDQNNYPIYFTERYRLAVWCGGDYTSRQQAYSLIGHRVTPLSINSVLATVLFTMYLCFILLRVIIPK